MRRDLLAALASGRSRPGPLVLDFRSSSAFGFAVDTVVPAGCAYTRAASPGTVQTGTSGLYDLSIFSAIANLLVWGRASDAWEVGLVLEEARTNLVANASNYAAGTWATTGSITRTTGQTGPTGGALATRLECAAGTNFQSATAAGLGAVNTQTGTTWVRPHLGTAPADVGLLTTGGTPAIGSSIVQGADASWRRLSSSGTPTGVGAFLVYPIFSSAAVPVLGIAAHDWDCYGTQIETGAFPTEFIPTSGGTATRAATFLRVLSAVVAPKLSTGRLSLELKLRAKGARTEYSGTRSLWYVDANNQAAFVASTGVLTVTVAGATNTCTLPSWARYDLVEISVQCGGSLATVVKYRLNSGAVTSLAITGTALGTHATGDVYLFSTNAGQHLSCWAYAAAFYAPGAPSWAS